ncbi:unnamed protein product [Parnassius apollo]|uniref:(apollo) hypothetical protein n=1 Tax=Parnassius apollo TaxID=110799 RepID=A0A8S3XHE4_PARAO|nr:unnamed protein product [Parnassius apollo]
MQEYNSQTALIPRLAENLKAQWEAMKKAAKKEAANTRMAILKTGGGSALPKKEDPCTKQILSLISTSVLGLYNPYDSDAILPAVPTQYEEGGQKATITPVQYVDIPQSPQIIIEDNSELPMDDVTMSGCETQTPKDPWTPFSVQQDWGDYSPQLLRTPVSASLKTSSDKRSGISRRRPEHNSTTNSLEMLHMNKIEAINLQKNIAAEEADQKKLIAQIELDIKKEILKQEKIKTELLLLELRQKQSEYQEENKENSEEM